MGIWHETYRSRPGDFEGIYVNMPTFGLAKAGQGVAAVGNLAGARRRMAASGA